MFLPPMPKMSKVLYLDAFLLDGTRNMNIRRASVMVQDGIITDIIEDQDLRSRMNDFLDCDDILPLRDKYLMPGLINLHVHLPSGGKPMKKGKKLQDQKKLVSLIEKNPIARQVGLRICANYARDALYSGVTTVRAVGGVGDLDTTLRDQIEAGKRIGPRILAANTAIATKEGHMAGTVAKECDSLEEAVAMVEKLAAQKVDLIKLMITGGVMDSKVKGEPGILKMPAEWVRACCEKAHALGLPVAAHAESPEGVRTALENGVDTIEHGSRLDKELVELFRSTGASLISTISPAIPLAKFPSGIIQADEIVRYNAQYLLDSELEELKTALGKGLSVGIGTDAACPYTTHYDFWRELVYTHRMGHVPPEKVLNLATLENARIAGIDSETGSIEVGKRADLVVTDSDPLQSFEALRAPALVVKQGVMYTRPEIKKFPAVEMILDDYLPQ